tara:strand:+ start:84 stop:932 length:849 start_codon:yes stop_codon:yes gene_type:complete
MEFSKKLSNIVRKNSSILVVGLDPDPSIMPVSNIFEFNKTIIDNTIDVACAYKPNFAFYESSGLEGTKALYKTVEYIRSKNSNIVTIADAKRGDIGNTNKKYAFSIFDEMGFDAVTLNPFGGKESLDPFVDYVDKGIFIWCRSSNPLSEEVQKLKLDQSYGVKYFYEYLSILIYKWYGTNDNVGLVAGATNVDDIVNLKKISKKFESNPTYLIPGVGSQGGSLEEVVSVLGKIKISDQQLKIPYLINSSRSIIYASVDDNYAKSARNSALKFVEKTKKIAFE